MLTYFNLKTENYSPEIPQKTQILKKNQNVSNQYIKMITIILKELN